MRKLLTAVVLLPVAVLLLIFSLANRTPVVLSLDPFSPGSPVWAIQLPLFVLILASIAVGVVIGGVADWFSQGRYRREARHQRHEVRRLEQEAKVLRRSQASGGSLPVPYPGDNR